MFSLCVSAFLPSSFVGIFDFSNDSLDISSSAKGASGLPYFLKGLCFFRLSDLLKPPEERTGTHQFLPVVFSLLLPPNFSSSVRIFYSSTWFRFESLSNLSPVSVSFSAAVGLIEKVPLPRPSPFRSIFCQKKNDFVKRGFAHLLSFTVRFSSSLTSKIWLFLNC